MIKPLLHWLAPAGPQGRLSVLILHRVLPQVDPLFPLEVDATRFDELCRWTKDWFNVLPLDEAAQRLKSGSLPARAAAISFDDGYADNHDVALPILQRHGLTATFFVTTGYLDGGRMWNDTLIEAVRGTALPELDLSGLPLPLQRLATVTPAQRTEAIMKVIAACKYLEPQQRAEVVAEIAARSGTQLPTDLMMRADQVRALRRAGMQVGAHTVTHPILARLDEAQARREIVDGKQQLESLLGEPVSLFAYPNGKPGEDYRPDNVELVRQAGFDAAFSTAWGSAHRHTDPFQVPRFTPWDRSRSRFGLRMARNLRS